MSTDDQRFDRQIQGLQGLADELHVETVSAVSKRRPVYEAVKAMLEPGDVLVIWDLDRAYRSAKDALNELDSLHERGVHFLIANLQIDTSSPTGYFIYVIMSGLADFERRTLGQRTKEGIEAARKAGKRIGRPPKMTDRELRSAAKRLHRESSTSVARDFGVAPWTLMRAIRRMEARTSV